MEIFSDSRLVVGQVKGEKKIVARRTVFVSIFRGYIQELISSDCAKDDFL